MKSIFEQNDRTYTQVGDYLITESLKEVQPLEWVSRMNSIRSRAEEIILHEVILTL